MNYRSARKSRWLWMLVGLLMMWGMVSPLVASAKTSMVISEGEMGVGDESYLWIEDEYGDAKKAEWSTSDASVVKLGKMMPDHSITVLAKKVGKAVVTAEYKGKKYTCKITVKKPQIVYRFDKKTKTATITHVLGAMPSTVTIPSKVKGYTVTKVGQYAFAAANSSIKKLILPGTVEKIGSYAFAYSNLKQVVLSENLKTIGAYAFNNCANITKITLPQSLEKIGERAFMCSGLKQVKLPANLKKVGSEAFLDCDSLQTLEILGSNVKLKTAAFYKCKNLKTVKLPADYTGIDGSTFLSTQWIKDRRKESSMVVVNGVLIDAKKAKGDAVVPDGVKEVASYAFLDNSKVKSVTLPESVEKVDAYAFDMCEKLKTFIFYNPNITIYEDSIADYFKKPVIYAAQNSAGHHFAVTMKYTYKPLSRIADK